MSSFFEIKSIADSGYQFDFVTSAGDKVLISAEFEEKSAAEQAIQDVRIGSMMSEMISVGKGPNGEKFFVIKNRDGQVLVRSVFVTDEMDFNNILHNVRDSACIASVKDSTL